MSPNCPEEDPRLLLRYTGAKVGFLASLSLSPIASCRPILLLKQTDTLALSKQRCELAVQVNWPNYPQQRTTVKGSLLQVG